MKHKFNVGDRVKHILSEVGEGVITYLIKRSFHTQYVVSFDSMNMKEAVVEECYLSKIEPEKAAPKYKINQEVWIKAKIASLPDSDGDYEVITRNTGRISKELIEFSSIVTEKDIRPLNDEPIKPEEIKQGLPVWIEGFIDGNIVHEDGEIRVRVIRSHKHENNVFYALASQIKLRHEDE
jgi:hypothetical protein